jgi:hypothetical protein
LRRVGGGEELRAGGEFLAGGRDGAARGGALRAGAGRVVDRGGLTVRVVDRGGLTVRGGVEDLGGATVRDGLRRSRLPLDGLVVRPDPTVPCAVRAGALLTRLGSTSRIPVGLEPVGRAVRRSAAGGVTVRPGGVVSIPRRTPSPALTGVRASPTVRRPSAPFGLLVTPVLRGAATRPRPLMVGSVVAGAAAAGRRRASSDPDVAGDETGVLAAAVRRVAPAGLRPGDDAAATLAPVVRRRAVTDCGCSP